MQPHNLLLQQGRDGLTVQQVLQQNGLDPTPQAIAAIAMKSRQVCRQYSGCAPCLGLTLADTDD